MSRIKTDLKPTVKSVPSLSSTSPRKGETSTRLPPVSLRATSASPRASVDLKWTVDMVRGFTIQGSTKEASERQRTAASNSSSSNSDPHRSSKDYEKLYQKNLSLQKLVSQLRDEIKVKNKTITELQEQLTKSEAEYNHGLEKQKDTVKQYEEKMETFYNQIKELKEAIMERTKEMDSMKKEVEETKNECDKRVQNILQQAEVQSDKVCQRHKEELASRDSKLAFLKMQLESALNNNSRERQRQLDELTKELKRVTDETEMLKTKLRALSQPKESKQCHNCAVLKETLQSKLAELSGKDDSVKELLQHCQKMAVQLSRQDEFLKLCDRNNMPYKPR